MRTLITVTLLLCLLPLALLADDGIIRDFTATNSGQQTLLEWSTDSPEQISLFHVQRSFDGRQYYTIADVSCRSGVNNYSYNDDDLFKGELHTFYYRIEAVTSYRNSEFSEVVEVTVSFSGIKRTWGSIKAMFR